MQQKKIHKEQKHPRLSLSMIVKNEEKFIAGCLESVKNIVDEIVIVDTGSTDRTIEIAQSYNAKIFPFTWIGDFSAARNESLRHCTGDWVMWLDADERIAEECKEILRQTISQNDIHAFTCFVRGDECLPSGTITNVSAQHRLFKRLPNFQFEGKIHEQIVLSMLRNGCTIGASNIFINHLGYAQSVEIMIGKLERNLVLLRKQLESVPDDAYSQFQLGNTLTMLCRNEEAYCELQKTLFMPTLNQTVLPSVLNLLASLSNSMKEHKKGIEYAQRSLRISPHQVNARWTLASLFVTMQDYTSAIPELQKVISIQLDQEREKKMLMGFDTTLRLDDVWYLLGLCFEESKNIQEAVESYIKGLKINVHHINLLDRLLLNVHAYENENFIIREMECLYKQLPNSLSLKNNLIKLMLRMKKYNDAKNLLFEYNSITIDEELPILELEYYLGINDLEKASIVYENSKIIYLDSYAFHKTALQFCLAIKNRTMALEHLGKMSRGVESISVKPQTPALQELVV